MERPDKLLVVVFGLPGTGKSEISQRIATGIGAARLNTDIVRKELYPKPVYSAIESETMYREVTNRARCILAAAQSVIVDGTFNHEAHRETIRALAAEQEAIFKAVHIVCSDNRVLKKRLDMRVGTGNPSDADWKVYQVVKENFAPIVGEHLQVDNFTQSLDELNELVKKVALPYILDNA